jgi:hypothetical protein
MNSLTIKNSSVIARLKAEVKNKTTINKYDRTHNRHNRNT